MRRRRAIIFKGLAFSSAVFASLVFASLATNAQTIPMAEKVGVLAEEFFETPAGARLLEEIAGSPAGLAVRERFLGKLGLNVSPLADQGKRLLSSPDWSKAFVEQAPSDRRLVLEGLINDYRVGLAGNVGAATRAAIGSPFTLCREADNCQVVTSNSKSFKQLFYEGAAGGAGKAAGAAVVAPLTVPAIQGVNKWCNDNQCAEVVAKRLENLLGEINRTSNK